MAQVRDTLHAQFDTSLEIYPNIIGACIPNKAVTMAKLSQQVQDILNNVSNQYGVAQFETFMLALQTALSSYGMTMSYTLDNGTVTALSISLKTTLLEVNPLFNITTDDTRIAHDGKHYYGNAKVTFNESVTMNNYFMELTNLDQLPDFETYFLGVCNAQFVVVYMASNGKIMCPYQSFSNGDDLYIKLDWWAN